MIEWVKMLRLRFWGQGSRLRALGLKALGGGVGLRLRVLGV